MLRRVDGMQLQHLVRQSVRARLNRRGVPLILVLHILVQYDDLGRTRLDHLFLVRERTIAQLAVVAGQREIAQRVQPAVFVRHPVVTQHPLPRRGEVPVLRHDVLDAERIGHDLLLALVLNANEQLPVQGVLAIQVVVDQGVSEVLVAGNRVP